MHDRKGFFVLEFENVLVQYEPMISHSLRKLNIYRDHEQYRQAGRVALWQAWTRFDDEKGDFTPFAYRSIRGAMLDELKRENRLEENVMPMEDDVLVYVMGGAGGDDGFDHLRDAIERLSPSEKALIQWIFVEGCSLAECADRFGISVAGVKKRRQRMLKKLKELIEEEV